MMEFLHVREAEVIDFTRDLIRTPSENPPGDERAVAALVIERLSALGLHDVHLVGELEHRPNLIARIPGRAAGPNLVLCGHLDTKPAGDLTSWNTDPWDPVVRDGHLIGLGSGDMKAALAAMVYAAAAVSEAGGSGGDTILLFTADEEAGSGHGSKWLSRSPHLLELNPAAVVLGEPSGIEREWEAIHIVSRGAALFKIAVLGTQMHSSVTDRLPAINAVVKMARLIDRMDRELLPCLVLPETSDDSLKPTVNIGVMVSGGVYYGVCPGLATFGCDIRTLPGMTEEQMTSDLQAFLSGAMKDDPDLHAELTMEAFVPATEVSPGEPVVMAVQEAAALVLGHAPPLSAFPGGTDACHLQGTAGIPTVASWGPGLLPAAHSPNESLQVDSILIAAKMYALIAWRFGDRSTASA
jgi:acetylornithine deacetylase/succinyl-diaminopimelate desuccinylase-like protein